MRMRIGGGSGGGNEVIPNPPQVRRDRTGWTVSVRRRTGLQVAPIFWSGQRQRGEASVAAGAAVSSRTLQSSAG